MLASHDSLRANSPQRENTSSELLDNLIDVLIHPTYYSSEWLEAIGEEIPNPDQAGNKISAVIKWGAKAGVHEATTRRLVVAVLASNDLKWSDEKIDFLVTGKYKQQREQEETDRRRRQGLPPLK